MTNEPQGVRALKSPGLVLARNAMYNFFTQVVVSVVAFASLPIIVRGLGDEAFGILALLWMVVGYFSILDFGVGQASIKFLAEHIGRGENDGANATVWASVAVSGGLGLLTGAAILLLGRPLLDTFVSIPVALRDETLDSFSLVAIAVPFVMVQGAFRAVPMAVQRFDLFNLMLGLSGLLQWGGSLVLVVRGAGLVEVVMLTVAIRVVGAGVACGIAVRLFPGLSFRIPSGVRPAARKLLNFGGWFTVSQVVSPVARYLDRLFVVSYHSLKTFTSYAAPFEAMSRLQVIPLSLSTTLYPAMSERETVRGKANSYSLFMRAINFTILLMLPMTLVLVAFSRPILDLWLGGDFPILSNDAFRILAAAAFIQAVCYVPLTALQALGRPDAAAKYYLAEIPLYAGLCLLLIPPLGIVGAAWAYCIRMALSTLWLLRAAYRALGSPTIAPRPLVRALILNLIFLMILLILAAVTVFSAGLVIALGFIAVGYFAVVWLWCMDHTEKEVVRQLLAARFHWNARTRG